MSRHRVIPLAAAFACGLIPIIAKMAAVKGDFKMNGPCTEVTNACDAGGPNANGCRDVNTGTYSDSSCEMVTLLSVFKCSDGNGECTNHSPANCAKLDEYFNTNCQTGQCR